MINFFRRIRQNLLQQGQSIKYLKYAIGEIVLVVIGILIALAISKWNNNLNDREIEERLIIELYKGLKNDKALIEIELHKTKDAIHRLKKLDALLKVGIPEVRDSLNYLFGAVYGIKHLQLNLALYEDLKATGLSIVKDAAIRLQIIKVFENHYPKIERIYEMELIINQINRPYYLSNFNSIQFLQYASPNNLETLWNDVYYKNIVHYRIVTLEGNQESFYKDALINIDLLLELIDKK